MIVHAGCLARWGGQAWAGVLVTGPSGSGKSDLAMRLIERGWRLVADDRTMIWRSGDRLFATVPETLAGLVEVRGLDVVGLPRRLLAPVVLIADCLPTGERPERIPEPAARELEGIAIPAIAVNALESSAAVKLELALARQGRTV